MFERLPIDNLRQIMDHLTIGETWSLFQACGQRRKLFLKKIRAMTFPTTTRDVKMMLPVRCNKQCFRGMSLSRPPFQYVPTSTRFIGDYAYCQCVCPCCKRKSPSIRFSRIDQIHLHMDPQMAVVPRYVSTNVILAGFYTPVPENRLQVGNIIDVLVMVDFVETYNWRAAIILSCNEHQVGVRCLAWKDPTIYVIEKASPRLALFRKHTIKSRNFTMQHFPDIGGTPYGTPLAATKWRGSTPVHYHLQPSRYPDFTMVGMVSHHS